MAKIAKTVKPNWGVVLSNKGLVVSLSIRWFKGQRKLTAEDLDLEKQSEAAEFQKLFSLGQKSIIPKEVFNEFHRMETRARSLLDKYSFETPFGQFVTYEAFPIFEKKIEEIEKEFREAVHETIAKFPKYRGQVLADYAKLSNDLFTNGNKRNNTARLLNAVRNSMPSRNSLHEYYSFEWEPFHIATPSELVQEQKKATVLAEGKAVKYQVNKKLAEKYEKKSAHAIDSFISGSIKKMRGVVNELVVAALKSIDKNDGVLVPRLSTTLKGMVDQFKLMNAWGDQDIEAKLLKLKEYLHETDGDGPKRTPEVKAMLKELRSNLKERISESQLSIRQVRSGVEL